MAVTRFVEEGLEKGRVREYILDNYGEEAFLEDGNIKLDILRDALNTIDPEEDTMLYNALQLEMSLNDQREEGTLIG